jgi:hypothetical protein
MTGKFFTQKRATTKTHSKYPETRIFIGLEADFGEIYVELESPIPTNLLRWFWPQAHDRPSVRWQNKANSGLLIDRQVF